MLVEGMIGALISAIGFAMMLDTPKKYLPHVGLVGIILYCPNFWFSAVELFI